jgi:hypothetical protein
MHLKVFLKLKRILKPSLLGKKNKKTQKIQKKQKKKKKPQGWVLKKNPGFFQPCLQVLFGLHPSAVYVCSCMLM